MTAYAVQVNIYGLQYNIILKTQIIRIYSCVRDLIFLMRSKALQIYVEFVCTEIQSVYIYRALVLINPQKKYRTSEMFILNLRGGGVDFSGVIAV